ncbi:MAG TPA: DNA repair protein RadA [Abditibacteriaceae bacterium]|jgi:DNA repair protein RadA/Sms
MAKISTRYVCQSCGYDTPRWVGKCPECGAFNTFAEEKVTSSSRATSAQNAGRVVSNSANKPQALSAVGATRRERLLTGIAEFDRVLGGGVVMGSLVLIGGDPGIGKSTLLLEAAVRLASTQGSGMYLSGEESAEQIRLRADRLGLASNNLMLASETDLTVIESHIREAKPAFAIVDSIQTVAHPSLDAAPGTLSQVREGATTLQRLAKESGSAIFIVGHVNKEGNLAGPRALEHIVDAVLQLEGDEHYNFRILRALKNRFGSTNELGVFEMTEGGMAGVENPSQLFLSERQSSSPGSVVVATVEGSRPLLVEVQALCAPSYFTSPRRTVTGADFNRVNVALAVIEKRLGMRLGDMDVYVNVVGGVRVHEPALDLGIALAVISSLHDVPVPADACVFGEVGLAGEVRAVSHADRRATEAGRLGFARCIMPRAALAKIGSERSGEACLQGVSTLADAVHLLLPRALEKKSSGRGYSANAERANRKNGMGANAAGAGRDESEYDENSDVRSNTGAWQPVATRAVATHGAPEAEGGFEYSSGDFDDE